MTQEHYSKIDSVCRENKIPQECYFILNSDLSLLVLRHKKNTLTSRAGKNTHNPQKTYRAFYAKQENIKIIEPEILFKTIQIKKTLHNDLQKTEESMAFGEKMEAYIKKFFPEPNKTDYIKILNKQDKRLFIPPQKSNYIKGTSFE